MIRKVEIYSKNNCAYCDMAMKFFDSKKIPYQVYKADNAIVFNDGFSSEIKNDKPRSFWNLLKFK